MFFDKRQRLLNFRGRSLEQIADAAQSMSAVGQRDSASLFQCRRFVFARQCFQADQYADRFHPADLRGRLGPGFAVWADRRDLPK